VRRLTRQSLQVRSVPDTAIPCLKGDVIWPVEFLLTKFNRRHVFLSRKAPRLRTVGQSLQAWGHRLRWRFAFQNGLVTSSDDSDLWKLSSRRSTTSPCFIPLPQLVEAFFCDARDSLFEACRRARNWAFGHRALLSYMSGVVRLASRVLKNGDMGTIEAGKCGGFALCPKDSIAEAKLLLLRSESHYVEMPMVDVAASNAMAEYGCALKDLVEVLDQPLLGQALLSDFHRIGSAGIFSLLQVKVKTHKPQGSVSCRALHAATRHPMAPAMRYIVSHIDKTLRPLKHLYKSTRDLRAHIASTPLPPTHAF
jgi:hypothetical protein